MTLVSQGGGVMSVEEAFPEVPQRTCLSGPHPKQLGRSEQSISQWRPKYRWADASEGRWWGVTGRERKGRRGGHRGGVEDVRGDRQRLGVPPTIESMREPRKSRSEAPEMGGIGDTLPWNRGNPHSHTGPRTLSPRCIRSATAEPKRPSPAASLQAPRSLRTGDFFVHTSVTLIYAEDFSFSSKLASLRSRNIQRDDWVGLWWSYWKGWGSEDCQKCSSLCFFCLLIKIHQSIKVYLHRTFFDKKSHLRCLIPIRSKIRTASTAMI